MSTSGEPHPDLDMQLARRRVAQARGELMQSKLWRHVRTGGIYWIQTVAIAEATGAALVIYTHSESGTTWARPAAEFLDGRFVPHKSVA